jgi:hypothetical protein
MSENLNDVIAEVEASPEYKAPAALPSWVNGDSECPYGSKEWCERALNLIESQAMDAAPDRTPAGEGPHEMFEHFVQEAISNSPEPLQELGKFLADRLDEDDWKTADRLLLAAATRPQASLTAEEVAEIIWTAFWKPTVGEPGPRPRPDDWVHEAANRILARLSPSDRSGS